MTHSYNMACPINGCDMTLYTYAMTHWCMWQDAFVFVMWLTVIWHDTLMYVTYFNESNASFVTYIQASCHMHELSLTNSLWQDAFVFVMWLMKVCDMTHSYIWRDVLMYATRLNHICDMTHSCMWHDSFIYMTWLMDVRDMIHSYIWHDALVYVTWLIRMKDVTHWCIWDDSWTSVTCCTRMYALFIFVNEDSLIYMTWHINVCEMAHLYSWRNVLLYERWLLRKWVISYTYELCLNASCHEHGNDSFIIVTWSIHQHKRKKEASENMLGPHVIHMNQWVPCHTYRVAKTHRMP